MHDLAAVLAGAGSTICWRERATWRRARTLEQLASLTAEWLNGDLASQPGYYGSVDVDENVSASLIDALIALNDFGVLTRSSQAGHDGPGYRGHWLQHAAVDAVAHPDRLAALQQALADHLPHLMITARRVEVTFWNGVPHTGFGGPRNWHFELQGCHRDAIRDVRSSVPIVIYDTRPGPHDDLWRALVSLSNSQAVPR